MISMDKDEHVVLSLEKHWMYWGLPLAVTCLSLGLTLPWFLYRLLRFLHDEIVLTNRKFYVSVGVISKIVVSTPVGKINNVYYGVGILGRLLDYGTIYVQSAALIGGSGYNYVKNPEYVHHLIETTIEQADRDKDIRLASMLGSAVDADSIKADESEAKNKRPTKVESKHRSVGTNSAADDSLVDVIYQNKVLLLSIAGIIFASTIVFIFYMLNAPHPQSVSSQNMESVNTAPESITPESITPESITPESNIPELNFSEPDIKNVSADEAATELQNFHQHITSHQFQRAFSCLSRDFQRAMNYDAWARGFSTTVSSSVSNVQVVSETLDRIVLTYRLTAVDNPGGTSHFDGQATLIREDDVWKIDEIINRVR